VTEIIRQKLTAIESHAESLLTESYTIPGGKNQEYRYILREIDGIENRLRRISKIFVPMTESAELLVLLNRFSRGERTLSAQPIFRHFQLAGSVRFAKTNMAFGKKEEGD
jgi:hypothetical protein